MVKPYRGPLAPVRRNGRALEFPFEEISFIHAVITMHRGAGYSWNVRCCSKVFNTELYMEDKTMTAVAEYMTRDPVFISVRESLQHAADLMNNLNVGVLPVCDGNELVGMLTDRDIVVHAVAQAESGSLTVEEIASEAAYICHDDDDVTDVKEKMAAAQIRRVPVIDHNQKLVGMFSLGDLATRTGSNVGDTLTDISQPSEPD
jgi:CBS domain-containing protein